jgi:nucleoid DNA-binding protein
VTSESDSDRASLKHYSRIGQQGKTHEKTGVRHSKSGFTESLLKDERIEIRGLGSFSIRNYKRYTGRNPKSGEKIPVKPKRSPFFKVGKELKEKVNSGK